MASEHHILDMTRRVFKFAAETRLTPVSNLYVVLIVEEIGSIYGVHHATLERKTINPGKRRRTTSSIPLAWIKLKVEIFNWRKWRWRVDARPNIAVLGGEGHHFDVENEIFLLHEELYYSTSETQTDDSYEDIEHYSQHGHIEPQEAERKAKF